MKKKSTETLFVVSGPYYGENPEVWRGNCPYEGMGPPPDCHYCETKECLNKEKK